MLAATLTAYVGARPSKGWGRPLVCLAGLLALQMVVFFYCFRGHLHANHSAAFFLSSYPHLAIALALLARSTEGILVALSTGFALALCLLGLALTKPPTAGGLSYQTEKVQGCDLRDAADVGYELCPSSLRVKTCQTQDGTPVYRATITSDEHSRRILPFQPPTKTKKDFLAFGCSRTFGDGVSDTDTFPNQLARALPAKGTMYALSAWSPSQFIGLLQRPDFWAIQGKPANLNVIYLGIISHIYRSSGAYYESVRYAANYPKYTFQGDNARRVGTLGDYSFWKFLAFPLLNQFNAYRYSVFETVGHSVGDYLDHLRWIRREVARHVPGAKFYVVLHPGVYGTELRKRVPDAHFQSMGYQVLDATGLFPLEVPYIHHEKDNHLSAAGNAKLAEFIADSI